MFLAAAISPMVKIVLFCAIRFFVHSYQDDVGRTNYFVSLCLAVQGSYMQVCVKFKDFSRTSKRLSYCFKD